MAAALGGAADGGETGLSGIAAAGGPVGNGVPPGARFEATPVASGRALSPVETVT
jgi:hypothetical protein